MLVEFRVANFRSFRDEQTFSLVASKDEKLPGNLITTPRLNLLKSAALYGANASGKSNLVKAMQFVHRFVVTSAIGMNTGDPIVGISPFRLDEESHSRPSAFEVSLCLQESVYRYGFTATNERVYEEWLVVIPSRGKKQRWFERLYVPKEGVTDWAFGGPLAKDAALLRERTRENALVLSRGADLNVQALAELYLWFLKDFLLIDFSNDPRKLLTETMELTERHPEFGQQLDRLVRDADLGIEHIEVTRQPYPSKQLVSKASAARVSGSILMSMLEEKGKELFGIPTPKTIHRMADSDRPEKFHLVEDESAGTVRLFALAGTILKAIRDATTVVVDEIDCSMHPLLTWKLLELFQSPELNKSGAQLVVTTHDSSLMDLDLFRRDQIWIAEKNRSFATELCSLYDFKERPKNRPRNTEAVERNYLAGRYGGVPRFGATFEDLVLK